MRNKKMFQSVVSGVMCSTLIATTPIMTYATPSIVANESGSTLEDAKENGFVIKDGVLVQYLGDATDVVIPSGVTSIEGGAFKQRNFESITVPGTVKCIKSGTFGKASVKKIVLEEGVETIEEISNTNLRKLVIPSSVTYIEKGKITGTNGNNIGGNRRFSFDIYVNKGSYAETFFTENKVQGNILTIYDNGCVTVQYRQKTTLIEYQGTSEKVTIPEDVEIIWGGFGSYYGKNFVSEIILPKNLVEIKSGAFVETTWIKNLRKENPVVVVNNWLLDARTATGEVVIPENVTNIADGSFYENQEVTKVVIPDGITKIGAEMFASCSSLTEVVIPVSVTSVEGDGLDYLEAFINCESLTTISYKGTKEQWNAISWDCDGYGFYGCPSITVNCIDGSITYDTEGNIVKETDNTVGSENPFSDVSESQYYYTPVLWALENNVTTGLTSTTFAPEDSCTRGQVVTFLWRAMGCPEPNKTEHPFVDIEDNGYYTKAVLWALENGITTGYDKTHFAPEKTVTREQFVTFLHRAENKPAYTTTNPFSDVAQGTPYYDAILWAYENEVTKGYSDARFAPQENCTRGQLVTFLYRGLNK